MNEIAIKKVRFFLNLLDAQQQTGTGKRFISFPPFLLSPPPESCSSGVAMKKKWEKWEKGGGGVEYNRIITNLTILRFHKYVCSDVISPHCHLLFF